MMELENISQIVSIIAIVAFVFFYIAQRQDTKQIEREMKGRKK